MTRKVLLWIGRAFFSAMFLLEGIKKILHWDQVASNLAMKFCEWYTHLGGTPFFEALLSFVPHLLILEVIFEIGGGLLFLSGYGCRIGALLLLLFLIPTTLLYHDFWFQVGENQMIEKTMFMKNLSLIGALLVFSLSKAKK